MLVFFMMSAPFVARLPKSLFRDWMTGQERCHDRPERAAQAIARKEEQVPYQNENIANNQLFRRKTSGSAGLREAQL
jgi:hypothetical protein